MTNVTLSLPAAGEADTVAEPKVTAALEALATFLNTLSYGFIASNANINNSSGDFTCSKVGTGEYKIKWTVEHTHAAYPVLVVCAESANDAEVHTTEPGKKEIAVFAYKAGVPANLAFSFLALRS